MTVFPSFFRGQNFLSVAYSLMRSQVSECRCTGIDFKTWGCRRGLDVLILDIAASQTLFIYSNVVARIWLITGIGHKHRNTEIRGRFPYFPKAGKG